MEVGVIYLKLVFPNGSRNSWLSHCGITSVLPKDLHNEIKILAKKINTEYADDILIPMDCRVMPGCTTKPEAVDMVAKAMYDGFITILKDLGVTEGGPRCVYSVGEIDIQNIEQKFTNKPSTHYIGAFPVMIKVGKYLDYGSTGRVFSTESGLFRI